MKYTRKDNLTMKPLYILLIGLGLAILYLGIFEFSWAWVLLTLPIGLLLLQVGYKNYVRSNKKIQEVEFLPNSIKISFLNGRKREIENKDLRYSVLVKKFYQPIRSIEFLEKKKLSVLRGESIGIIDFGKWESSIEPIAQHLIRNQFERKKWKFGWSTGDILMIAGIFLGLTEGLAENYIVSVNLNVSDTLSDLGQISSEERAKMIANSKESEDKYFEKNREN